jgi:hypothetical protein
MPLNPRIEERISAAWKLINGNFREKKSGRSEGAPNSAVD